MEEELKKEEKKDNKKSDIKKILKIVLIVLLIGLIISVIILYRENRTVQNFIDENIFKKTITEDNLLSIDIDNDTNTYICAFSNYIGVVSNNTLTAYNSYAKKEFSLSVTITTPIFSSSGKYLAIAEKNGNKIYLIADKNIVWQADVEGTIEKITVNKNGYLAVAVSQTSYRSVVITYNTNGKELCRTYLSSTYAVDMDISNDNKSLAIAETNLSGIQIKAGIRIISLEKVDQDPENAVIYKEEIDQDTIITSIHYDNKNNLICMLTDKIIKIENLQKKDILEYDENALFADIDLDNQIVQILNSQEDELKVKITNTINQNERDYIINSIPKEMDTKGSIIAINTGSEAYFIKNTGFLIKKYEANQEIKQIVISENIAGIIYKNKIEIIKL